MFGVCALCIHLPSEYNGSSGSTYVSPGLSHGLYVAGVLGLTY